MHGARVVVVDEPGAHAGDDADAAVTAVPGAVLAVHTADCVPVVFTSGDAVGVAHAGWRGLAAGVIGATVDALGRLGVGGDVVAHIGPHIRASCYEFGSDDLDIVAGKLGDGVRSTTHWATPALDLTTAVLGALDDAGIDIGRIVDHGGCTSCEPRRLFSHRARRDAGRMAAIAVLSAADDAGRPV